MNGVSPPETRRRRTAYLLLVVALSAVLFAVAFAKRERLLHLLFPSRAAGSPTQGEADEESRARRMTSDLRGYVVWSSNRFGNHDILMMSFPDWAVTRLTNHPHAEYFPRVSPDGKWVLFARAQRPNVSQRNPESWDIFAVNVATGAESQIAQNGNAATWSEDGKHVYFQRNTWSFIRREIAAGTETVLYRAGVKPVPSGVELQTPCYSTVRSAMAVTYRRAARATVVVDADGNEITVGKGCQLAWSPDSSFLYWVDHGGLMENRIYRFDWKQKVVEPWLDLPAPYSHEYFPKLSSDGDYMILGASSGGHEHDLADYEIFLWRVGTRSEHAVRLTYHTGNDNWPDIFLAKP